MKLMRTLSTPLAVLVPALVLSACGSDSDSGSDADDVFGDLPDCSEVWEVGKELDLSTYEGCVDGDQIEAAVTSGCYDEDSNYRGQVATYKDVTWVLQTDTDPKTGEGGTPGKVTDENPDC